MRMSFFVVSFGDGNNKGGAGGGGSSDCGRRVFHARRWRIVANQVQESEFFRDRLVALGSVGADVSC
ncbi:hypothetical protein V6N12_062089 [Hibiscus sabdariffa]|uniref:Uncharacterized protein n=1 Tax=Hibiscus sabdariffa TaxID=183260 RepID=A0ABR2F7W9_9ROSI